MVQGVITGDIVESSKIGIEDREQLIYALEEVILVMKNNVCHDISFELFRGDSFQIIVNNPSHSLLIAILIRVALLSNTPQGSKLKWDARISIGIGSIDFISNKISTSDGEAFKNSGRGFDDLKKNERLIIQTPWQDFNKEFEVSTGFADNIITKWTKKQAVVIFSELLTNSSQKDIAQQMGTSKQNISNIFNSTKVALIKKYINRFIWKIEEYGNR